MRGVQCSLATGRSNDALAAADALEQPSLSPPERMWTLIYRGIALDRLGRREEAVEAYHKAATIHPHPVARAGADHPLFSLRHLDRLGRQCAAEQ